MEAFIGLERRNAGNNTDWRVMFSVMKDIVSKLRRGNLNINIAAILIAAIYYYVLAAPRNRLSKF
ncbi:MAG: hypothetical protein WCG16_12055 [Methylococcales bacterium]